MNCLLCAAKASHYHRDRQRSYYRCSHCRLIFADPFTQLSAMQEKAVYDQHQNFPGDAGYRRFLSRLATPLMTKLTPGQQGLDFGCGPGPTLNMMLTEAGFPTSNYDPYYWPDRLALQRGYDFVTCTEVVEHFNHPRQSWRMLMSLVHPGGWLGIMTKQANDNLEAFSRWHYKNDPTHVAFYTKTTLEYLSHRYGFSLELISPDVALMQRLASSTTLAG